MTCGRETIPRHCAEKFEEISVRLGKLDLIARDVRLLRMAVVGNGVPERSLAHRLRRLEERRECTRTIRARWAERLWKLCVATALVVFGWWIKSRQS